jgi:toxin FitB
VLSFDLACTPAYAALMAEARAAGRAVAAAEGYIAAVAIANGFVVATRDTGPFAAAGAAVLDPWQA